MTPGGGSKSKSQSRARAWAADIDAARRRAGLSAPAGLVNALGQLRATIDHSLATDLAPGRLTPWLPVAFGIGILIYFAAEREPAWWAALSLVVITVSMTYAGRRRAFGFPVAAGLAAMAAGFAVVTLKTILISHPVLGFPVSGVAVSGFVEHRQERARSDRIVVRVHELSGARARPAPERVRVAVRKGTAPAVGTFVTFNARLSPPLQPLRPGGYDFAQDMYFQRIGASGYVLGTVRAIPPPVAPGAWLGYITLIDAMRSAIDRRIRGVLSGDHGSIASALITGKRDAISARVNDAMYISSLAHVLSISGYHMAVVAGLVFFMIRAGFALAASVANRYPIKKWAAIGALLAASFYLVLSGAEVATQRSYIMIAVVLVGVLCDRPALTFRTLAIAASVVLLLAPEAVVHPSFQMSFAATLALVAAYYRSVMWQRGRDSPVSARIALWGGREIAGLILASLVAGLATTPYAAFHFHRLAPYGVIANLLAMPVVSAWVMPMGILGMLFMPFGFDGPFWRMMGQGIDWMMSVALWVVELPGAVGRIHAFGPGPLLLATAGLLLICLFRSRLRWSGAVLAGVAVLWAVATPKPDLFVAPDGQAAAIRGVDGRLAVLHSGRDTFAVREWLAADGDPRAPGDASLKTGTRCDEIGCIGPLPAGGMAAFSLSIEGLADDCSRSTIVISRREAPSECAAVLLDRKVWRSTGALALRWNGAGYDIQPARPRGYDRPWSVAGPEAGTAAPLKSAKVRPAVRNATPAASDLTADD